MAGLRRTHPDRKARRVIGNLPADGMPSIQTARDRRARRATAGIFKGFGRKKAHSSQSSSALPPVLVRRDFQSMATPSAGVSRRRVKTPRRRFDLTLDTPGVEIRLPSLPVVRFSWRICSGLMVMLMMVSLVLLLFSPTFQADIVEVEGLQRLTLNDLLLALDVTGQPVISLNPVTIRTELLQAFPDLKDAHVRINLPASVSVEVVERQPVIIWERGGETLWVDEDGVVFLPRGELEAPLVTLEAEAVPFVQLTGSPENASLQVREQLDPKLIRVLLSMSQYMPEGRTMIYDPAQGLGWSDERGWQVFFGSNLENMDQKLIVYQAIVDRLEAEGVQPVLISLEYLHAPYFRLEH